MENKSSCVKTNFDCSVKYFKLNTYSYDFSDLAVPLTFGNESYSTFEQSDWKTVLKLEASPEVSWLKLSDIFFIHVAEHKICLL